MQLRWRYYRILVEEQDISQEWKRKGNYLSDDEFLMSDHVETEPNEVNLIVGKVHTSQYKTQISKLAEGMCCHRGHCSTRASIVFPR